MSENQEQEGQQKKAKREPQIPSSMFEADGALIIKPESNTDLEITKPTATYTEYKASEETWTIAFQQKKRDYLKGMAQYDKFVVFLDSNSEEKYKKNPILEPKYDQQIILQFRADISNRQYEVFNKLRAEVQDMERSSFGTIIDYKEMGVRPPDEFTNVRIKRYEKEKMLYNIGLQIFFKFKRSDTAVLEQIPDGMIDQMEMRSTRDLIDAMDIRLNLGIRKSATTSTDILSTKKNMSLSIT